MNDVVARLRELLAKATLAEWCVQPDGADDTWGHVSLSSGHLISPSGLSIKWSGNQGRTNAALIVEAVNALPTLLDELERLSASPSSDAAVEAVARAIGNDRRTRCGGYPSSGEGPDPWCTDEDYNTARAAISALNPRRADGWEGMLREALKNIEQNAYGTRPQDTGGAGYIIDLAEHYRERLQWCRAVARAALSAHQRTLPGWQEIESAPKDGTRVIAAKWGWVHGSLKAAFSKEKPDQWHLYFATTARFEPIRGFWTDGLERIVEPTHYLSIPPLAALSNEQTGDGA